MEPIDNIPGHGCDERPDHAGNRRLFAVGGHVWVRRYSLFVARPYEIKVVVHFTITWRRICVVDGDGNGGGACIFGPLGEGLRGGAIRESKRRCPPDGALWSSL